MGNIIPAILLIIMYSAIIYYLVHALKTKGTICTACSSCAMKKSNNQYKVKQDLMSYYKNL